MPLMCRLMRVRLRLQSICLRRSVGLDSTSAPTSAERRLIGRKRARSSPLNIRRRSERRRSDHNAAYMAQTLFPLLVNAPGKRYVQLPEGHAHHHDGKEPPDAVRSSAGVPRRSRKVVAFAMLRRSSNVAAVALALVLGVADPFKERGQHNALVAPIAT